MSRKRLLAREREHLEMGLPGVEVAIGERVFIPATGERGEVVGEEFKNGKRGEPFVERLLHVRVDGNDLADVSMHDIAVHPESMVPDWDEVDHIDENGHPIEA